MRRLLLLAFAVTAFAQDPPQPINKDALQGYSKDVLDQKDSKPALQHPKQLFKSNEEKAPVQLPEDLQAVVTKQFGSECVVAVQHSSMQVTYLKPKKEEWTPFLEADLNNDGVPDAVVAARCKQVLSEAVNHSFKLADPYMTNYGYGDPKETSQFTSEDPEGGMTVLVLLGAGKEGWRAAQPKGKWALINLPFDNLALTNFTYKKKTGAAVLLVSRDEQNSVAFWDGKKWLWRELTRD